MEKKWTSCGDFVAVASMGIDPYDHFRYCCRMRNDMISKLWVIAIVACCSGCSSDDSGADSGTNSSNGNDDAVVDKAEPDLTNYDMVSSDLTADSSTDLEPDAAALKPEAIVGTWQLLRMECPKMDSITFVDYTYVLKLEQTKGSALDSTATCTLTTEDFPVVETAGGFDLQYDKAVKLSCDPSPCTLTMKTKIGTDVTEDTYSCPADFPQESPKETIVAVEGTTMRTWYPSMMCKSFYERVE